MENAREFIEHEIVSNSVFGNDSENQEFEDNEFSFSAKLN
jgi:hypothetical protein